MSLRVFCLFVVADVLQEGNMTNDTQTVSKHLFISRSKKKITKNGVFFVNLENIYNSTASEVTMSFSNVYQNLDIQVADNSDAISSAIKPTLKPRNTRTEVNKIVELKDEDIDIDEKIHEENPYGDFYVNEEPLIDIEIKRFGNVIEEKSKNENDGFKKEYAVGSRFYTRLNNYNIR